MQRLLHTGDTTCWYEYQNDSFLVHHMLDFGTNSKPVFYDYNGDGLLDIVVGNYGYFDSTKTPPFQSALAYYQNTGTATHPKFKEITLDVDSFSKYNLLGVSQAFGDLTGDGKPDMLVGDAYGHLYFLKNTGTTGSSFPAMTSSNYFNISVNQFAAPFIYDLNGDSLNDILVGRLDGGISYYWNYGTKTNPLFSPDSVNNKFGNISVKPYGGIYGYSQPFVYTDKAGTLKLLVGSQNGTVYEYNIDRNHLRSATDTFPLIDSNYLSQSVGKNASISVADINGDGDLEYLMGTATGGIMMYSDSVWDPVVLMSIPSVPPGLNQLLIYPNPAKDYFVCSFGNNEFTSPKAEVFNLVGEQINTPVTTNGGKVEINSALLSAGFYMVKIQDEGKTYTGKIMIAR